MSKTRLHIAWGVMGYGRGHATRVRSVLPALMQHHDVTVFAGGDAYPVLAPLAPIVRIPTLGYVYGPRGDISVAGTFARNAAGMSDLLLGGHGLDCTVREFRARKVDLVISDSEAWTHRAAQRLRLPRISFDHIGVIAWCKPHFPAELWLRGQRDGLVYRELMGRPDRTLITSFYPAQPAQEGTQVIGPVLREELLAVEGATCWRTSTAGGTSTRRRWTWRCGAWTRRSSSMALRTGAAPTTWSSGPPAMPSSSAISPAAGQSSARPATS